MTTVPAHGMTATTSPFQDPRRQGTETPWCVILASPKRDIFEHHHFASFFDAAVFHKKAERPVNQGFVVPTCQCGHTAGDHITAAGNLHVHHGPCYECDCPEYREARNAR